MKRRWRLVAYPVLAWLLFAGALMGLQERLIFPRHYATPQRPDARPRGAGVLKRALPEGGEVEAWFLPADDGAAPLVVLLHGNAELIDHQTDLFVFYAALGYAVLAPEYRGYGRSAGEPGQDAIVADVLGFLDDVTARPDIDAARVVLHGRSLGGAVAAQVAKRRPPAALILDSAPASIAEIARRYLVPPFLVRHPFRTLEAIRGAPWPILVMHGTRDDVVPVDHGRRLAAAAPRVTYVEHDGFHTELDPTYPIFRDTVTSFLRAAGLPWARPSAPPFVGREFE